jgi:hypothetical protein
LYTWSIATIRTAADDRIPAFPGLVAWRRGARELPPTAGVQHASARWDGSLDA